jgi:septum site-determining protein MinC
MAQELVVLKGTGDGVKIFLSPEPDFQEILRAFYQRLDEYRYFFRNGTCNIYFTGRDLSKSDKIRLESVVSVLLPDSQVFYGYRPQRKSRLELDAQRLLQEEETDQKPELTPKTKEKIEQILSMEQTIGGMEVIVPNFKQNRARFYQGDIKEGQQLQSDGHLVMVGDVQDGGEVVAVGNVIIIGALRGCVAAGIHGNEEAYIIALDFAPEKIAIANVETEYPPMDPEQVPVPEKAYLINNRIYVDEFLSKI